jgi:hypothetical protein
VKGNVHGPLNKIAMILRQIAGQYSNRTVYVTERVNLTNRISTVFTYGKEGAIGEESLRIVLVKERDEFT